MLKLENDFAETPLEHTIGLVHEVENFKNQKFALKLTLRYVCGLKITHGSFAGANFIALRWAHVVL